VTNLIEAHTHADLMPYEAYEELALKGVNRIITHSCYVGASRATTLFDHYHQLLKIFTNNAQKNGLKLFITVGIHPLGIPEDWPKVIDILPTFLEKETIIGLGEVGLHFDIALEAEVLKAQVELAKSLNVPIDLHLPPKNRSEVVTKTLDILAKVGIDPQKVVIEHVHTDVIKMVNEFGAYAGLSLGEGRLSPQDILENASLFQRGMLNSDYINFVYRRYDAVPKAVHWLKLHGVDVSFLEAIAFRNAEECWKI